ncbi:MAG: hypothetical protein ABWX65_03725 [Mycetocola sp.]
MSSRVLSRSAAPDAPVAVLLPGTGYTVQAPLLFWSAALLAEAGWTVVGVDWSGDAAAVTVPVPFVEAEVEAAFGHAPASARRLIVAKSFGCFALPWARRHGIPGVWLTPLLTDPAVADAVRTATSADLVVGGDADDQWLPDAVDGTSAHVMTLPGAGHALTLPGDWRASMNLQADLLDEVAAHIARLD